MPPTTLNLYFEHLLNFSVSKTEIKVSILAKNFCIELGPWVIVRLKPLLVSLPEVFLDRVLLPELLGADPTREDSPIVPQSFGKVNLLVVAGPGV